jgi:uncharacterized protein (TIRG00374 family)
VNDASVNEDPQPAGGRARGWILLVLRLLVSLALLAWLLQRLEGGLDRLGDLRPHSLWLAALIFATSTVLGAVQWAVIVRHSKIDLPHRRLHVLYWIGLFVNNFLPSNVGGDLVKVTDVAMKTGRVARPVAATLLDRLLGLSALVTVALVAGAILGGRSPAGLPWWVLVAFGLPVLVICAGLLSRRLGGQVVRAVGWVSRGTRGRRLRLVLEEIKGYRLDPRFVLKVALLALVVQSLRVLTHVAVAAELGVPLDGRRILELFVLIPVLGVAIVLPISFNGLGLREWIATRLMPTVGIGAEAAFALELATYLVQVGVSLLGGVLFAWQLTKGKIGRA